ncbi:efflux RND transporter periplasmic adaptor subunit [Pelagicoccus enzymogenes]|uniref:efflux RND transporter periplasmic adaptor subunit n=1 Tax=Pelagicoccus enzymogenes TaxID=2773457 RepID=UPI0028107542|nr:efflux RND transporter periplasmic adaptor subunit [Pelagicoccus enzymogenes]MDQ8198989.1 efflux RND transporter periplasmic adaptor subunit [Pelagicoccus enzymogenes]
MKTKNLIISAGIALLIAAFLIGRWTAPSPAAHDPSMAEKAAPTTAEPEVWTCSMHPQIQQPEPGDCPICGMDLIPLENDSDGDEGPRTLSMSESSRALANIQTSVIERRFPTAEIRLVGKLEYDETKVKSLTARFPARIDELFVNFPGVPVQKGDHLARVYSPELLTAQSELITAHRYDPDSAATRAAKEKLLLWDLLPNQVDAILKSGKASDTFELKAPIAGIVVNKNINEGDYIKTGQSLFRIVDLNTLWLQLNAYESDLAWLRFGQQVTFSVEAYPGQNFQGQITFIEPEINRATRTVAVRVNVDNAAGKLKPGMFAKARAKSQVAQAGSVFEPEFAGKWISPMHPEIVKDGPGHCDICGMDLVPAEELGYVQNPDAEPPLVIPASAVLRTGKRAVAYIEKPNTSRPTFEGREIELGPRAGEVFVVRSGLAEGDRVVTNGAFKIDSALQIKAKPSMMNPQGDASPPSHHHGDGEMASSASKAAALEIAPGSASQIVNHYLAMQSALAGDDLEEAKNAANAMMKVTGHSGDLPDLLHDMLAADDIDAFRRPHFEKLSNAFIAAAKTDANAFEQPLTIMHCPMVYPDRGADWLQGDLNLKNPYFGAMMLTCGEVKGTLGKERESSEVEQ